MEPNEKLKILQDAYDHCVRTGRVKSKGDFAALLGVSQPSLSSALNGDTRYLTDRLISRVIDVAKGEEVPDPENTVPLFPFSVRAGASLNDISEGMTDAQCERITSPVRGAELATEVVGDSMAPAFPAGARVLLARVRDTIAWGEVYVLDTTDGQMLKRIMPTDSEDVWELRSDNPAYPPFRIRTRCVRGVWRVLLRMIQ